MQSANYLRIIVWNRTCDGNLIMLCRYLKKACISANWRLFLLSRI